MLSTTKLITTRLELCKYLKTRKKKSEKEYSAFMALLLSSIPLAKNVAYACLKDECGFNERA
jgi:hypothetical protein